ncbi:hypothetical protein TNCV_3949411 [Trichonephila clavipes]|nr:hypothetical protein TNCV_3949411 [Trichonephila clavipes]
MLLSGTSPETEFYPGFGDGDIAINSVSYVSLRAVPVGPLRAEIGVAFLLNALAVPQREPSSVSREIDHYFALTLRRHYLVLPSVGFYRDTKTAIDMNTAALI